MLLAFMRKTLMYPKKRMRRRARSPWPLRHLTHFPLCRPPPSSQAIQSLYHMWLSLETCVPSYGSLQTRTQSSSPPGTLWIYIPEVLDLVCPEPPEAWSSCLPRTFFLAFSHLCLNLKITSSKGLFSTTCPAFPAQHHFCVCNKLKYAFS